MKRALILLLLVSFIYPLSCSTPTKNTLSLVFGSVNEYPVFTVDGSKIVYYHSGIVGIQGGGMIIDNEVEGLWIMDKDGSDQKKLLEAAFGRFSSDGNWLVYYDRGDIYKVPFVEDAVVVAEKVQLTFNGNSTFHGFSPDGEWISYRNFVSDNVNLSGIRIMKPDGSEDRRISMLGLDPSWHPNGKEIIAYTRVGPLTSAKKFVRYFPFDSTMPDTLNAVEGNDNQYPGYSPDGKKIVFSSHSPEGPTFVYTMNSNGTMPRKLEVGGHPSWSPDGTEIAFISAPESKKGFGLGTVWIMDSNGDNIRQLTKAPDIN